MKPLILRLILPLSLIFFILITKWWFVETELPINYLYGFPLPYTAACVGGNGCVQYFIIPLAIDIAVYFLALLLVTWLVHRFNPLRIPRAIGYILWAINVLYYIPSVAYKNMNASTEFYTQREFRVFRTLETGFIFVWEDDPVIDYSKYRPAKPPGRSNSTN
jgi:hypothetical protein